MVTDCAPAPPLPGVDAGVVLAAVLELDVALEPALGELVVVVVVVVLLLLLPQPVATIAVTSSATTPSHPVRVVTVSSSDKDDAIRPQPSHPTIRMKPTRRLASQAARNTCESAAWPRARSTCGLATPSTSTGW